jgi:hypothetical protein
MNLMQQGKPTMDPHENFPGSLLTADEKPVNKGLCFTLNTLEYSKMIGSVWMLFDIVEENHSELNIFSYFASRPRGLARVRATRPFSCDQHTTLKGMIDPFLNDQPFYIKTKASLDRKSSGSVQNAHNVLSTVRIHLVGSAHKQSFP